jgi:hypothetical protein
MEDRDLVVGWAIVLVALLLLAVAITVSGPS